MFPGVQENLFFEDISMKIYEDKIIQILDNWGLNEAVITPVEQDCQTAWDINGIYVLKKFRNAEDLSSCTNFSKQLSLHKIPVVEFIETKNGSLSPPGDLYCLMTKLPGVHVNFYEKPELANEMGRGLALLHNALSDIEEYTDCNDSKLIDDWCNQIKPSLNNVPEDIITAIDKELKETYPKLPRQLIHRDFHPRNVLFEGDHISGWLDFDLSHRNIRIFDIAYFLAGLIIGNIGDPVKINIWHEIRRNLIQGYNEINPLSDNEISAIPAIMIVIEFLFVWYWSKQNNSNERDIALDVAMWLWCEIFEDEGS